MKLTSSPTESAFFCVSPTLANKKPFLDSTELYRNQDSGQAT